MRVCGRFLNGQKIGDGLLDAVIEDVKIFALQAFDKLSGGIANRNADIDTIDADADRVAIAGRRLITCAIEEPAKINPTSSEKISRRGPIPEHLRLIRSIRRSAGLGHLSRRRWKQGGDGGRRPEDPDSAAMRAWVKRQQALERFAGCCFGLRDEASFESGPV